MRSFLAWATLCLATLLTSTGARVADNFDAKVARREDHSIAKWFYKLLRKDLEPRQNASGTCYEDAYYKFVYNSSYGEQFCQALIQYPRKTTTTEYTPTSTETLTTTTEVITNVELVRTTPLTTVTVTTTTSLAKRDVRITHVPRSLNDGQVADVFDMFRRLAVDNTAPSNSTAGDAALSSSFSSACSCQTYGVSTVTATYTNEPSVTTLDAFTETTTTTTTTTTARERTDTTTTTYTYRRASSSNTLVSTNMPSSVAASTTTTSSGAPTPTAQPFTCPHDNGTTVSQLVGNQRYDYLVLCGYVLTDPDFYGSLYYKSFAECVAACSTSDNSFSSPVCQGVSYYSTLNVDGYNCFLKASANNTVPAPGVDSALLQRIAVGISGNNTFGTSTEAAPFSSQTPTNDPSKMSSTMSSIMSNSSTSMPIITPPPSAYPSGLLVNTAGSGYTSYTTIISDGSTFSSGTVFSTGYTSGSVWYYSYYTSYTETWASATTVEASSETGTSYNSSSSSSSEHGTGNGGFMIISVHNETYSVPAGCNVTEVQSVGYFNGSGVETSSSVTTQYFTVQTPGVCSGNGTNSGGNAGGASGNISSGLIPASVTYASAVTTIYSSGAIGGASSYAASGNISSTVITNAFGTAYSSGYLVSGMISGTGGIGSGYGSGSAFPTPTVSSTVITNGGGTAYSSGYLMSGVINGTGAASSTLMSGVAPTTSPSSGFPPFSAPGQPRGPGSGSTTPYSPTIVETIPVLSLSMPALTTPASIVSASISTNGTSFRPTGNTSMGTNGTSPTPTGTGSTYITPVPTNVYSFSAPGQPRGPGTDTSSSTSAGVGTSSANSSLSYSFSAPGQPRGPGSATSSSSSGTVPLTTGLAGSTGFPPPSGNATTAAPTGTAPASSRFFTSSANISIPFISGTTAPSITLSTAPASICTNGTMGTVTMWSTTTEYGCFPSCVGQGWGGYGGLQTFGPPTFNTVRPVSSVASSSASM